MENTQKAPEIFSGDVSDAGGNAEDEKEKKEQQVVSIYYEAPPEDTEVIGVRFRTSGKVYYFDPDGKKYPEGCHAVVETARGTEYGYVSQSNHIVSGKDIVLPLRKAVRIATPEDDKHNKENIEKAEEAFLIGNKKIEQHGLDMKLIDTEYTFDNSKLLFYFTSDGRVDFRELVKDLASVFRCRIELRQMGIRDEAKVLGGLGTCGRPFCCHSFLPDFVQVSIKMAKEQNLSLNSNKISGACGRLMCCLRYEYDAYLEEGRLTPKVDSLVNTPDGISVVLETKPLLGLVKVKPLDDAASAPKVYHRDLLSPIRKGDENYEKALEEKNLEKQAKAAGTTRAALKAAAKGEQSAEQEQKPQRPVRPAPQKAASYTDQVMPSALARNPLVSTAREESSEERPGEENPAAKAEKNNSGRNRGRNRRGGSTVKSGRETEDTERQGEIRQGRAEAPEKGRQKNLAGSQTPAQSGENAVTAIKQPRYEKTLRQEAATTSPAGKQILSKREYGERSLKKEKNGKENDESAEKKPSRAFRSSRKKSRPKSVEDEDK